MSERVAVVLTRSIELRVAGMAHWLPAGLVVRILEMPDNWEDDLPAPATWEDARLVSAGSLVVGDVVAP